MESQTVRMVLMRMTARSSQTPATSTTSIAATAGTVSTDLRYSNNLAQPPQSPPQLCDGDEDCPAGDDEEYCQEGGDGV